MRSEPLTDAKISFDDFNTESQGTARPGQRTLILFSLDARAFMIVPWLTFMAVGLVTYTGFVKLAARLLRYSIPWKAGFLFAAIVLVLVSFAHLLAIGQPLTFRTGQGVALLLCVFIVGAWFFSERGTNYNGTVVGWGGGLRLVALAFAMMVIVAFAIALLVQFFLTKNVSPSP